MLNKKGISKALSLARTIPINRRHAIRVLDLLVEDRASYICRDFEGFGPTLEDVSALTAVSMFGDGHSRI